MFTTWLPRIALIGLAFAGGALAAYMWRAPEIPRSAAGTNTPAAQAEAPGAAEIEAIVRRFILRNPEIVQEAMVELERRQTQAELDARRKITQNATGPLFVSDGHTVIGNPQGDATIVEFFDYNCGYCKRGLGDLQKLVDGDRRLRIILKEFPILSPGSVEAARVALALRTQFSAEQLWQFHGRLLGVRGAVGRDQALAVARELGADMARIEADIAKPVIETALQETRQLADQLGLTGTPSYVVGDEVVVGAVGYDALKARLDAWRKCGRTNCG